MMKAQSDPSDSSLVFECDFEAGPEKVWRALTEPRLLETWLAPDEAVRTDSGGEQAAPRRQPAEYEILRAEPHRLLRYRWRDRESGVGDSADREVHSVVTVELAPRPEGGTHLRLTHGEFRIVSLAPHMTARHARPITRVRRGRARRAAMVALAAQYSWRRAA
jgi:uncharacterized protein YndB with AHSA1/START domain